MVRAGEGAFLVEEFLAKNRADRVFAVIRRASPYATAEALAGQRNLPFLCRRGGIAKR